MTTSAFVISVAVVGVGLAWLMRGFLGVVAALLVAFTGWMLVVGGVVVLVQTHDPGMLVTILIGVALVAGGRRARGELALRSIDRRYAPAVLAVERHRERQREL